MNLLNDRLGRSEAKQEPLCKGCIRGARGSKVPKLLDTKAKATRYKFPLLFAVFSSSFFIFTASAAALISVNHT